MVEYLVTDGEAIALSVTFSNSVYQRFTVYRDTYLPDKQYMCTSGKFFVYLIKMYKQ